MSALQFLSKKSWHTATIRNEEKVWLKEKEAAKEKARIEELQKQLEEERKLEEIQRLEIESGRLDPAEVLKRRRLNWMYEHGPNNQKQPSADAKDGTKPNEAGSGDKKDETAKSAEGAGDGKDSSAALYASMEEKMREDPLVEIERDKALARNAYLNTHVATIDTSSKPPKASKYTAEELAAKLARKEYRRSVREERRQRREERAKRKRKRERDSFEEVRQLKDTSFAEPDEVHERSKDVRDAGESEEDPCPRGMNTNNEKHLRRYGLQVPMGGTQVAVTTEFVPRHREEPLHSADANPVEVGRHSHRRPPENQIKTVDAEERQRRLKKMKEDALRLNAQRRRRVSEYVGAVSRDAQDVEVRRERVTDDPASAFAKEAIARNSSAAGRIKQRRAWASNDSNASY